MDPLHVNIFLVWLEFESQWASWWVLVELLVPLLVLFWWGAERDPEPCLDQQSPQPGSQMVRVKHHRRS